MTYDLKIGYQSLPLVTSSTLVFFREALRQLGAKRQGGSYYPPPPRRPRYEKGPRLAVTLCPDMILRKGNKQLTDDNQDYFINR